MAMSVERPVKRVRINGKSTMQAPASGLDLGVEDPTAVREAYLVTFPHPSDGPGTNGGGLLAPAVYTRAQVRDAVLAACNAPVHDPAWLRRHPGFVAQAVPVQKMVIFREYHATGTLGQQDLHYHVALLLDRPARFMPLKRAILAATRLASHWSCSHIGYWSTVSYGITATVKKPRAALDPAPLSWCVHGVHPPLEEAAVEPTTARALAVRRQRSVDAAGEKGKAEPRAQDIDLWPHRRRLRCAQLNGGAARRREVHGVC